MPEADRGDDLTPEEIRCVEDFYAGRMEIVHFDTAEAIAWLHNGG